MTDHVSSRGARYRSRCALRLGAVGLALVSFQVGASTWNNGTGWVMTEGPDGVHTVLPGTGGASRTGVTCSGGNCTASGSKNLPSVKPSTAIKPSSPFTKGAIARGAAGVAGRILLPIAVGTALYDWYTDSGVTIDPQTGDATTEEGGTDSGSTYVRELTCTKANYKGPASACAAAGPCFQDGYASNTTYKDMQVTATSLWSPTLCKVYLSGTVKLSGAPYSVVRDVSISAPVSETWCFDRTTGVAVVKPIGGICPGGVVTPATPERVAQRLENTPISDTKLAEAFEQTLKQGGGIEDADKPSVTGPSSVTGPTTTRTVATSNGTQSTSTTNTTYNMTYNSNVVTVTQNTTTTNPDGSTETETKAPENTDPCKDRQNTAGCVDLGDPGVAQLPTESKNVTFTPVQFASGAGCPAPITFSAFGATHEFSYDPMCDTIGTWVRALVLAIGAFIASWVFIQGIKA